MKQFLSFVELRTKITSVLPFLMVLSYLFYIGQPVDLTRTLLFFGAMFLFDLTTTAINNYIDTKTNGQVLPYSRRTALRLIVFLFCVSAALGLSLAWMTDLVVFLLGGLCFLCGLLYTWGPVPISRLPLGELFSGLFYGLLIPFLLLYINMPAGTYLTLAYNRQSVQLSLNLFPIFTVLLLSVAPVCATANIMLANNTCDVEKDVAVNRYTLPWFLGQKALYLFAGLYYVIYLTTVLMVILNILSPLCLLSLGSLFWVQKNIRSFWKEQNKEKTFVLSVVNFISIIGTNTVLIFISGLLS